MGFLDEAKGLADKAKDLATEHAEQVKEGVGKAADFIDDKTGDKFKDQIDKGEQFIADHLHEDDAQS